MNYSLKYAPIRDFSVAENLIKHCGLSNKVPYLFGFHSIDEHCVVFDHCTNCYVYIGPQRVHGKKSPEYQN